MNLNVEYITTVGTEDFYITIQNPGTQDTNKFQSGYLLSREVSLMPATITTSDTFAWVQRCFSVLQRHKECLLVYARYKLILKHQFL